MMSLRDDLAKANRLEDLFPQTPTNTVAPMPATVFKPQLVNKKTGEAVEVPPTVQTPQMRAHLDAKYGLVGGTPLPQMPVPIGDGLGSVDLQMPALQYVENNMLHDRTIGGVKLDFDIQIPDPASRYSSVMENMPVGASFLVKSDELKKSRILYIIKKCVKGNEKNFECHAVEGGHRVWRVS